MFESIKQFLVEDLRKKPESVTMDAELVGDLGINSLDFAELVEACNDKFNVQIDDEDLHRFNTVRDIVEYLEENQ